MLKATWRRPGSPAWLAIGLLVLAPSMAQAQLFPNLNVRRERPPCAAEPPFNAQVRRDYFGYYPTCWSRFPVGWACPCPNPELPNPAASFEKNPLGKKRRSIEDEVRPGVDDAAPNPNDEGMAPKPGDEGREIPLPNPGRSPFDIDTNPKPPGSGVDPAPVPNPNTPAPAGRPSGSAGLLDMPKLPATSPSTSRTSPSEPGSMALVPDATLTSSDLSDLRPDLGPLPTSPQPPAASLPTSSMDSMPAVGIAAPAQAPRRRGFLSGLFGGNTRKR